MAFSHAAFFFFLVSIAAKFRHTKKRMKNGSIDMVVALPSAPKTGGMNMDPTYADAISNPIIAAEASLPKYSGV